MRKTPLIPRIAFLFGLVSQAILVTMLLASCGAPDRSQFGASRLDRGINGEPETLSPMNFRSNQAGAVLMDLGEGLVRYGPSGAVIPGVAERWDISEDGLTYTFYLRADARWANGDQVTASNFVNSFRALVTPENGAANAAHIDVIRLANEIVAGESPVQDLGVIARAPQILEVALTTSTPFFLQLLAHPSTFPIYEVDTTTYRVTADQEFQGQSNGPFKLDTWIVGSEIVLVRNENYWGNSETYFDKVVYHILEESSELVRFRAGDLHITGNVPSGSFRIVEEEFPAELKIAPFLGVYYYGFNLESEAFKDKPDLRQALSLAIDREVLAEKITGRGEAPAYGWVPPGVFHYHSQTIAGASMSREEQLGIARELYRKSGYGPDRPFTFELRFNTSDVHERIAVAIHAMWQEALGAEAVLVNEEFGVLLSNIKDGTTTEVFRLSWTGDYNDATSFLQLFETGNPSNFTGYTNPEYDDLLSRASSTSDADDRRLLLERAERLVLGDNAVIPLYFYVSKHLVAQNLVGWESNVLDIHPSQFLSID